MAYNLDIFQLLWEGKKLKERAKTKKAAEKSDSLQLLFLFYFIVLSDSSLNAQALSRGTRDHSLCYDYHYRPALAKGTKSSWPFGPDEGS